MEILVEIFAITKSIDFVGSTKLFSFFLLLKYSSSFSLLLNYFQELLHFDGLACSQWIMKQIHIWFKLSGPNACQHLFNSFQPNEKKYCSIVLHIKNANLMVIIREKKNFPHFLNSISGYSASSTNVHYQTRKYGVHWWSAFLTRIAFISFQI